MKLERATVFFKEKTNLGKGRITWNLCNTFAKLLQSRPSLATPPWTVTQQLLCLWDSPGKILEWLPCPPPGDLPDTGIEPMSLRSPALAGKFFTTSTTWEALIIPDTLP